MRESQSIQRERLRKFHLKRPVHRLRHSINGLSGNARKFRSISGRG
jgi:hypothetical protein